MGSNSVDGQASEIIRFIVQSKLPASTIKILVIDALRRKYEGIEDPEPILARVMKDAVIDLLTDLVVEVCAEGGKWAVKTILLNPKIAITAAATVVLLIHGNQILTTGLQLGATLVVFAPAIAMLGVGIWAISTSPALLLFAAGSYAVSCFDTEPGNPVPRHPRWG